MVEAKIILFQAGQWRQEHGVLPGVQLFPQGSGPGREGGGVRENLPAVGISLPPPVRPRENVVPKEI